MKDWIALAVIYQINLRSLAAREPRNAFEAARETAPSLTPLAYVTKNLSRLKRLGVTVLHVMPPFQMGLADRKGIGSPYAARDYMSVDPEYGTLEEFRLLIRRAHELKFALIIGMVPNHTSRDNVWVHSHPDYYVKDADGKIIYDLDWSDTAKLDYTQRGLRDEMIAVYDFWLSLLGNEGVDGFRIDMAHFINDRSFWNEAIPALRKRHPERDILFMAECYGTQNSLDLFERGFNAAYDDALYKMWENFYGLDEQGHSMILPAPDLSSHDYFTDKYEAYRRGGVAAAIGKLLQDYEMNLPQEANRAYLARYTDNHDEGRGVYRFGPEAVRAMNALIFLSHRGLPFILTGQEFGAANRPSIHERIGPCDKGSRLRRSGELTQREGVEFEGNLFARGYDERQSWYRFHKELIRLRLRNRTLIEGSFEILDPEEEGPPEDRTVVAFERSFRRTHLVCAVNMGPDPRKLIRRALFRGQAVYGDWDGETLPGFSAIVVRK